MSPSAFSVPLEGDTTSRETVGPPAVVLTVIAADALFPAADAVTVAFPVILPVTRPLESTVATAEFDDAHV